MKSAVIVTDVQKKIFDSEPRPYEAQDVIRNINRLTKKARNASVPVFFLQHEVPAYLEYGSDDWQLHQDLQVSTNDIRIRKTSGDAFLHTDLHDQLSALNIDDLIICGYASEFCIDNTTRRATGLGYTVQLVSDAHTTHDKPHLTAKQIREHHTITLSMGATIRSLSTQEVCFEV